jgi:uncharacterized protein YqgC (DUF456 family)
LHYDTVLLALPIAWLAVDGLRSQFLPGDIIILAALWVYPFFTLGLAQAGLPLAPLLIFAALLITLRRTFASVQGVNRAGAALRARHGTAAVPF